MTYYTVANEVKVQEKIRSIFTENIQTQIACVENLTPDIIKAVERIVETLINGNRILCCGTGISSGLAQLFTMHMIHKFETHRPSLPAFALGSDHIWLSQPYEEGELDSMYAKQVKVLGQPNDTLLVISPNGFCKPTIQAIETAVTRDMFIIALTGADGGDIAGLLSTTDVEIRILSERTARINELHHFIINLLAEMVDKTLFNFENS